MAAIGGLVVGLGLTGGFAYGVYDLNKKGDTKSSKYYGFIAGLVIGVLILFVSIIMMGRAGYQKFQTMTGGGQPTAEEVAIMSPEQLEAKDATARQQLSLLEQLISRIQSALPKSVEAKEASKLVAAIEVQQGQ